MRTEGWFIHQGCSSTAAGTVAWNDRPLGSGASVAEEFGHPGWSPAQRLTRLQAGCPQGQVLPRTGHAPFPAGPAGDPPSSFSASDLINLIAAIGPAPSVGRALLRGCRAQGQGRHPPHTSPSASNRKASLGMQDPGTHPRRRGLEARRNPGQH